MVGAMADWFAVTALFRHPLGVPVPHTALVPKRKDELGRGLQDFVAENFLHEEIIRDRVAAAEVTRRVATWVSDPVNAQRVVESGVGLRLAPRRCTPARLRAAVRRVVTEPSFRANAQRLAQRLADRPGPPRAAELLEGLASRPALPVPAAGAKSSGQGANQGRRTVSGRRDPGFTADYAMAQGPRPS